MKENKLTMLASIDTAIYKIRDKSHLMHKLFDIGSNFINGEYHKKFGRYFKERPSYLIGLPPLTLGFSLAYITGHRELIEPSLLYSSTSLLTNIVGMACDHFSSKYVMKLNRELEKITGRKFIVEREKMARDENDEYSFKKLFID